MAYQTADDVAKLFFKEGQGMSAVRCLNDEVTTAPSTPYTRHDKWLTAKQVAWLTRVCDQHQRFSNHGNWMMKGSFDRLFFWEVLTVKGGAGLFKVFAYDNIADEIKSKIAAAAQTLTDARTALWLADGETRDDAGLDAALDGEIAAYRALAALLTTHGYIKS